MCPLSGNGVRTGAPGRAEPVAEIGSVHMSEDTSLRVVAGPTFGACACGRRWQFETDENPEDSVCDNCGSTTYAVTQVRSGAASAQAITR